MATAENTSARGKRNSGVKRARNASSVGGNPNLVRVLVASISLALPVFLLGGRAYAAPSVKRLGGGLVLCPDQKSPVTVLGVKQMDGSAFGYLSTSSVDCTTSNSKEMRFGLSTAAEDNGENPGGGASIAGFGDGTLQLIGKKVLINGPTRFNSNASMSSNRITDLAPGVDSQDAVNVQQLSALGTSTAAGLGGGAAYKPATGT